MQRGFLLVKPGNVSVFTVTKGKALLTTTTGALPRPAWYTENLRGIPLSQGFSRLAYREQHFDCLACHVAAQHRAGIDIFVDGDTGSMMTSPAVLGLATSPNALPESARHAWSCRPPASWRIK